MAAEHRDYFSFKHRESLKTAVIQTLANSGISSLSGFNDQDQNQFWDKKKRRHCSDTGRVFGLSLEDERQDRVVTEVSGRPCYLPKFFVQAVGFLKDRASYEGLFRKAGSLSRQKKLRASIEEGATLSDTADPHDVAALLKQYLRELLEPLLTHKLTPVLLECTRIFSDNSSLTLSNAILLSCLLLPTHHLLCLQVLMGLLKNVTSHLEQSLMDSSGLSIVIAPNILPIIETKSGKKKKTDSANQLDIKIITFITRTLIDNSHLIGQVPADVERLSEEIRESEGQILFSKKGRNHQRRGSMSGLLRGTFNRLKRNQKKENSPSAMSSDNFLSSPDVLGPSASKRPALDSSPCDGTSSDSSSPVLLFTKSKSKARLRSKQSLSSYKGRKKLERVPLLYNQKQDGTSSVTRPVAPPIQHDSSLDNILIESNTVINQTITNSEDSIKTEGTRNNDQTSPERGNTYKLVARTTKVYPKETNDDGVVCQLFQDGKDSTKEQLNQGTKLRKRKKSGSSRENGVLSTSQSADFAISRKCSHVTSSTPVNKRPQKKLRRQTDGHIRLKSCDTVGNNLSYCCAVEGSSRKRENSSKDILKETGNSSSMSHTPKLINKKTSCGSVTRAYSVSSKVATPLTKSLLPSKIQSSAQSGKLSKRAKQYIVEDCQSSNRLITTARSPWINKKGIQISEWML